MCSVHNNAIREREVHLRAGPLHANVNYDADDDAAAEAGRAFTTYPAIGSCVCPFVRTFIFEEEAEKDEVGM